jgi:hypothetical protein
MIWIENAAAHQVLSQQEDLIFLNHPATWEFDF